MTSSFWAKTSCLPATVVCDFSVSSAAPQMPKGPGCSCCCEVECGWLPSHLSSILLRKWSHVLARPWNLWHVYRHRHELAPSPGNLMGLEVIQVTPSLLRDGFGIKSTCIECLKIDCSFYLLSLSFTYLTLRALPVLYSFPFLAVSSSSRSLFPFFVPSRPSSGKGPL